MEMCASTMRVMVGHVHVMCVIGTLGVICAGLSSFTFIHFIHVTSFLHKTILFFILYSLLQGYISSFKALLIKGFDHLQVLA